MTESIDNFDSNFEIYDDFRENTLRNLHFYIIQSEWMNKKPVIINQ